MGRIGRNREKEGVVTKGLGEVGGNGKRIDYSKFEKANEEQ